MCINGLKVCLEVFDSTQSNIFHFAVGLYSDNVQRTSKRGENFSHATSHSVLLCSHHVLTSSVRYQRTDAQQNGIYLLNRQSS